MIFICLRYPALEMTYKRETSKEVDGQILKIQRQLIKFENGRYETDDKDRIAFIQRHSDYGLHIFKEELAPKKAEAEAPKAPEKKKAKGRPRKIG